MAYCAGDFTHIRLIILLHHCGVSLIMPAHQRPDHAFKTSRVFAGAAPSVAVRNFYLEIMAVKHSFTHRIRKVLPRCIHRKTKLISQAVQQMPVVLRLRL